MSDDVKTIIVGAVQFLIAALIGVAAFELYLFSALKPLTTENWIEIMEEVLLALSAIVFAISARRETKWAGAMWLIHGFFMALFIRELDAYFDMIRHGFWKYVLIAYLVILFFIVKRADFRTIVPGLAAFIRSRAFLMMMPGAAITLSYARLYGYKGLWLQIMGDYERWGAMKTFAEESTELVGYTLMFGATLFWLWGRRNVVIEPDEL